MAVPMQKKTNEKHTNIPLYLQSSNLSFLIQLVIQCPNTRGAERGIVFVSHSEFLVKSDDFYKVVNRFSDDEKNAGI